MRLATWNINGMNARQAYLTHWLEEVRPDIVGLQELKMVEDKFPFDALRAAGYDAYVLGQKGWNGVAVLVRQESMLGPVEVVQRGLPEQEAFGARLLSLAVAGFTFTTVYCPNGKSVDHDDFPRKLKWFDSLQACVERHISERVPYVLCGDFNVVPAPIDSWNEAQLNAGIFHTVEERARIERLQGLGLVDAYRAVEAEDPGFTWWDYRAGAFHKGQGLRIDLMLVSSTLAAGIGRAVVDRKWRRKLDGLIASDHAPLWVDLEPGTLPKSE